MIWCSKSFIEENPSIKDDIASAVNKPFMNDNVCQILMGLVEMETKYYHPNRNLISPEYKQFEHRNVQGTINYEEIRWSKNKKQ